MKDGIQDFHLLPIELLTRPLSSGPHTKSQKEKGLNGSTHSKWTLKMTHNHFLSLALLWPHTLHNKNPDFHWEMSSHYVTTTSRFLWEGAHADVRNPDVWKSPLYASVLLFKFNQSCHKDSSQLSTFPRTVSPEECWPAGLRSRRCCLHWDACAWPLCLEVDCKSSSYLLCSFNLVVFMT